MSLQIDRAANIVLQTSPYLLYRALVYGVICALAIGYLAILGVIGAVFGSAAFVVLLVASVGLAVLMDSGRLLDEHLLYRVKAGHVALVTEVAAEGSFITGTSQTRWAGDSLLEYFEDESMLTAVNELVREAIRTANHTLLDITAVLPRHLSGGAAGLERHVADLSLAYVNEGVLAYAFHTKNPNVFEAAKTAVVLYCQSWKEVLKNAMFLTLLSYVFVIVSTVVFLLPLGVIAVKLPEAWAGAKLSLFAMALVLGMGAKWVLFDPVGCTSTVLTFLDGIEELAPEPEWEQRLAEASDRFRVLQERAAEPAGAEDDED